MVSVETGLGFYMYRVREETETAAAGLNFSDFSEVRQAGVAWTSSSP